MNTVNMENIDSSKGYGITDCPDKYAFGDTWYTWLVPEDNIIDPDLLSELRRNRIRVERSAKDILNYFKEHSLGDQTGNEILLAVYGCETGALIPFSGDEKWKQMIEILERVAYEKALKDKTSISSHELRTMD